MKHVFSYQEIGAEIDKSKPVVFTCHLVARVTAVKKNRRSENIKVTITLSLGDTHLGIVDTEYASIADVLDAFQIDDLSEIWEVLA